MNILIVDDHTLLNDSLMLLLKGHYNDTLSVLQAESGKLALNTVAKNPDLDLVLLDIALPDVHGFEVLQRMNGITPDIKVIALSATITPTFIQQCIALGASGFIPKTSTGKEMLVAIELVLGGGTYIPAEALPDKQTGAISTLFTNRQLDVLRLIRQGLSNDEIASVLDISTTTVKSHVHSILVKLDVKNRTEAVNEALLQNLL